ncbi:hypothetical protein B0O99DRAFT_605662 [Bisporella sp. PMI_857]|nr:hypothetical protein B0O99DRAFT_605662 [Bisporella sp. PMI_857]
MSSSQDSVTEPIPISCIGGRYLLFDINVVTYLRRNHRICGTTIGMVPQFPSQNTFSGLPIELMPEEARILVENRVAYIINDSAWHKENFAVDGPQRLQYLDSVKTMGLEANRAADESFKLRKQNALARKAAKGVYKELTTSDSKTKGDAEDAGYLFNTDRPASHQSSTSPSSLSAGGWAITPSITYGSSTLPETAVKETDVAVPSSYSLFAHLHSKGYYLWPGLRFGCDYNVYPGDPMRFHAHFDAVSFDWKQEISLIHLVGGGRLGTRVKKAFLIGGKNDGGESSNTDVRTFSIEWGGM